jgi:hypothetical protein
VLHGAFVPSGNDKALSAPTRKLLHQIVQEMHRVISDDWEDYRFSVVGKHPRIRT